MTSGEHLQFKRALEAKRKDLTREIRAKTAELAIGDGEHDPIDQVQSMIQRDEAVIILARMSCTLSDVELSLRAMLEGCYGLCVICDGPIGLNRLETIPWASHCIRCQELLESKEAYRQSRPAA